MQTLIRDGDIYSYGDLIITPTRDQDLLAYAYIRLKQEGVLPTFFHEQVPDLCTFMGRALSDKEVMLGAFIKGPTANELIGFGKSSLFFQMGSGYQKAEVGEVFFRQYQHRRYTLPTCRMMIQWLFDRTPLDALFGATPEHNKAALLFMRAMGFEHTDKPIGGYTTWVDQICGAYVSWMTEDKWRQIDPFGLKSDSQA